MARRIGALRNPRRFSSAGGTYPTAPNNLSLLYQTIHSSAASSTSSNSFHGFTWQMTSVLKSPLKVSTIYPVSRIYRRAVVLYTENRISENGGVLDAEGAEERDRLVRREMQHVQAPRVTGLHYAERVL